MSSELAPPLPPARRRRAEIEMIRLREQQISRLQAEQRRAVAALLSCPGGAGERFVADELALAWNRSPRQASNRLHDAVAFETFPAVHALIGDGTWLLDHADAVLDELARSGLDHPAQTQVLDLVLSRPAQHTPYELRIAVRTAVLALFPGHAWEHANKTRKDRDVTSYPAGPGAAQLLAHGPVADVAAMMASIDALCWPVAPDDTRTLSQRRFDAIRQLVCGQAQPGQWQVQIITELTTVNGEDDHPAEIIGFGPVPAGVARQAAATGELRRIVVDHHGQLVAVDATVHRPDQPTPADGAGAGRAPFPVYASDDQPDPWQLPEPDPDAPSAEDLAWLEAHTDRQAVYSTEDRARAARAAERDNIGHGPAQAARPEPAGPLPHGGVSPLELHAEDLRPHPLELHVQHRTATNATPDETADTIGGRAADETADRASNTAGDRAEQDAAAGATDGSAVTEERPGTIEPAAPLGMPARWSLTAFTRALQRLRTDPVVAIDLKTDRYRPTTRLVRHLEARDRACIFPGCPRRAQQCDKDHVIVWPLGPTAEVNLANECEHHHQAKHHGFGLQRLPDGTFRWTTPAGHTHDRPPRPVLDTYRQRPPPDPPPEHDRNGHEKQHDPQQ